MVPTPPPSLRLFLGLWPDRNLLSALQQHATDWSWPASARRTPPERLHVTLHFIGNVAAGRLGELQQALRVPWAGCELVFDRAEVWPGGIAVLEAGVVPPELKPLHSALAQQLRELELPVETRRYRPHFTLARKAFAARPPQGLASLRWQVSPEYLLLQSLPGGRGYLPLQRFG